MFPTQILLVCCLVLSSALAWAVSPSEIDASFQSLWTTNAGLTKSNHVHRQFGIDLIFPQASPNSERELTVTIKQDGQVLLQKTLKPSGYHAHEPVDLMGGILYFVTQHENTVFRIGIAADGSVLIAKLNSSSADPFEDTPRLGSFAKNRLPGALIDSIMNLKTPDTCRSNFEPEPALAYFPEFFYPAFNRDTPQER